MLVVGIDPGRTGGIALYDSVMDELVGIHDMPGSVEGLVSILSCQMDLLILENVSAMTYVDSSGQTRGQGAKAAFTFGQGFGEILGVCAALHIPVKLIRPSVWKKLMGLSSDKSASREMARMKFPKDASSFNRKKDDGRAEAALLALFGAERFHR